MVIFFYFWHFDVACFVQLNILRLVMFYNLKLLIKWRRSDRLNVGLICSDVIKLTFCPELYNGFHQNFHSMCQIDATECTLNFVLIAHAVHELLQKNREEVIFIPPAPRWLNGISCKAIYIALNSFMCKCTVTGLDWFRFCACDTVTEWTGLGPSHSGFGLDWITSNKSIPYSGLSYEFINILSSKCWRNALQPVYSHSTWLGRYTKR